MLSSVWKRYCSLTLNQTNQTMDELNDPHYKRGHEVADALFYRDRINAPDHLEHHEVVSLITYILYGRNSAILEKMRGGRDVSVQ